VQTLSGRTLGSLNLNGYICNLFIQSFRLLSVNGCLKLACCCMHSRIVQEAMMEMCKCDIKHCSYASIGIMFYSMRHELNIASMLI